MTDEERQRKNDICDRLIKEGIDDREDVEAGYRTCYLTEIAGELGRKDCIAYALEWYEVLEKRGISGKHAVSLDYGRANAIATERYNTEWKWQQETLAREIFYIRRAVSNPFFDECDTNTRCMCLNNLGNRLRV